MEHRKQLLGGQTASALVVMVTAVMACVALAKVSARVDSAQAEMLDDLRLLDIVRQRTQQLVDATRRYLNDREDQQRSRLGELQRALVPYVDRLAARERIVELQQTWLLEPEADAFVAWLSRAAADGVTPSVFDHSLQLRGAPFFTELYALGSALRRHSEERFAHARALSERAQLGIAFTSTLTIILGFVLATSLIRKLNAQYQRLRIATNIANREAAARKELIEVAAHDLRAALNSVTLSATLLRDATPRVSERAHVDRIASAAVRMEHLLDDLADARRFDAGRLEIQRERCDTRSLIVTCVDMFLARAKEHEVHLRTENRDILHVSADRERLIQVFANLMNNALRFTPRGGLITLSAQLHPSGVRFAVTDTGPGIAPDEQPHVFDRCSRGTPRRRREGVGLGLDICKRLIEAHQGQIGVESELGRGTTFWFVLPT
jgi:signal transduction histidine kinase